MTQRKRLGTTSIALGAGLLVLLGCTSTGGVASDPAGPPRLVVWVANEAGVSLSVLDGRTGDRISTVDGNDGPHNVQLSRDSSHVWATGSGGVVQVGTGSSAAEHVAPAGEHPAHLVQTDDGVLVTSYGDGRMHHFDGDLTHHGSLRVGAGPHGMRVAPMGASPLSPTWPTAQCDSWTCRWSSRARVHPDALGAGRADASVRWR